MASVPMAGFRACPTVPVRLEDAIAFPSSAIRNQCLGEFLVSAVVPDQENSDWMLDLRQAYGGCVEPLTCVASPEFTTLLPRDRSGELVGSNALAPNFQFAIGLQVADVSPRFAAPILLLVNIVEVGCAGKIAVKREAAGNLPA